MNQPLLVMFLGVPGSGKSYFARHLAKRIDAVRLNGDTMRIAMFGSTENIEAIYHSDSRKILNSYVFRAIDYAVEQILLHGDSVVYDAHHNMRKTRLELEKLAKRCGALPVVVQIVTPYEVALERGQAREATVDQRQLSAEKMHETMQRHLKNTDHPDSSENVIEISGELPFEEQHLIFKDRVKAFYDQASTT